MAGRPARAPGTRPAILRRSARGGDSACPYCPLWRGNWRLTLCRAKANSAPHVGFAPCWICGGIIGCDPRSDHVLPHACRYRRGARALARFCRKRDPDDPCGRSGVGRLSQPGGRCAEYPAGVFVDRGGLGDPARVRNASVHAGRDAGQFYRRHVRGHVGPDHDGIDRVCWAG